MYPRSLAPGGYEKNDLRAKTNAHFAAVLHVHSNNTPLTSLPIVMGAVVTMSEIGSQNAITNANTRLSSTASRFLVWLRPAVAKVYR